MVFRFYTNTVSQASKQIAWWIFIVGMVFIGFGLLIYLLPELFAILAALVFWILGTGCIVTAVKIFWFSRGGKNDSQGGYRENVHIHIEDHHNQ
jgi:hypothetical protein